MSIRLLGADDQEVIRRGIQKLVEGTEIRVIAEATTGRAAIDLAVKHEPDVVLLDVRLPEVDGMAALGHIKLQRPEMAVLLFSAYKNPIFVARSVALGAHGYLSKGICRDLFLEAIGKAARGETIWTSDALRRVSGSIATRGWPTTSRYR